MFDKNKFVDFALDNEVISFGEQTLRSGIVSWWYADWRNVLGDVRSMKELSEYVIDFVTGVGIYPASFVGVPEGATALGIITQYEWAKDSRNKAGLITLPVMRSQPKKHGKIGDANFVGRKAPDKSVLLEDTTTAGETLEKTTLRMFDSGIGGITAVSLLDRMLSIGGLSAKKRLSSLDVDLYSLIIAHDILPRAYERLKPGEKIAREIEKEYTQFGTAPLQLL